MKLSKTESGENLIGSISVNPLTGNVEVQEKLKHNSALDSKILEILRKDVKREYKGKSKFAFMSKTAVAMDNLHILLGRYNRAFLESKLNIVLRLRLEYTNSLYHKPHAFIDVCVMSYYSSGRKTFVEEEDPEEKFPNVYMGSFDMKKHVRPGARSMSCGA